MKVKRKFAQGEKAAAKNISGDEFIEGLAKGLTGVGITALGAFLRAVGVLSGGFDDDDKKFKEDTGEQEFALQLPNGYSLTLNWLSPVNMPLFVGVNLYDFMQRDGLTLADTMTGLVSTTQPIFDTSMLSGLQSALSQNSYDDNVIISMALNGIYNYFGQAVPSVLGRAASVADGTRRSNYVDKGSGVPRDMQYAFQRTILGKVPGLTQAKEPYIDMWGEKQSTGGVVGRVAQNFIVPGYIDQQKKDPVEDELLRLYEALDDKGVLPSVASKTITASGEKHDLTAKQYTEYAELLGKTRKDILDDVVEYKEYAALSDALKQKVVETVYDFAGQKAKLGLYDTYNADNWVKEADNSGLDYARYVYLYALRKKGSCPKIVGLDYWA